MSGYELVELLGEGGMGCVYRAVHQPSGRVVAVKTLHAELRQRSRRRRLLLDEATAAAKLEHPNIVRLLDLGHEADGAPYLVMELAEGTPLDALIERWAGWRPIARALVDTLRGLASAHALGIVHRDLKPANVIVAPDGQARVLDFGVAAQIDPLSDADSGGVLGTPEYMPPEQLLGTQAIGPWTDLYAFGVMLEQIVRGRSSFDGAESMLALLVQKQRHVPERPPRERPGLHAPAELHALIEALIRPHHRARPRFAVEVAAQLEALIDEVRDEVVWSADALERPDSVRPTTVQQVDEASSSPSAEPPSSPRAPLELPAHLASSSHDPALGAALARLREVPTIGRAEERAELERAIAEVLERRTPRVVLYVGEPGIGKSHLARWGLAHVEREGLMEAAAGAYEVGGAGVAGGLRHALRRLVGPPGKDPAQTWAWFHDDALAPAELARYLGDGGLTTLLPADIIMRLSHAVLRAVSQRRPIYLWLDDLAWARDGALQLVESLLDADDVAVLIVATMRAGSSEHTLVKERIERIASHPRATVRPISVLDSQERAALIEGVAPLASGLAEQLADRVDGSPLLLVSLVQDWLANGALVPSGERYVTRDEASIDDLLVSRPLRALVGDRVEAALGAFPPGPTVEVLGRAALLGARFEHAALAAACADDEEMGAALDGIVDHALLLGLLRAEPHEVYSFDHGLVHEALVERIESSPGRRRALIGATNGLLARYGGERPDVAAMVADLLHRAGETDRAWDRMRRAIERAAWGADFFGAERYLERAHAWTLAQPELRVHVLHLESRVLYFALRYEESLAALARARGAEGAELIALSLDASEADVLFYIDRFAEAEAIARRSLAAAEDSHDPEVLVVAARATHRLADLAGMRGDLEEELAHRIASWRFLEQTGNAWRVRSARLNVAGVLAALARTDEALVHAEQVHREAELQRDEAMTDSALEYRAYICVLAGRCAEARESVERVRSEAENIGDPWRLTMACGFCALVSAELDGDEDMLRATHAFIEAYRAVPHDESPTVVAVHRLADRLASRGQPELAREVAGLLGQRYERVQRGFAEAEARR